VNQSSPVAHAPPGPPSAAAAEVAFGGTAAAPAAAVGARSDQQSTSAGPSGAGLGPAEYVKAVKLNLDPETPWPSRRSARFPSLRCEQPEFA
jgi:hypothetical protein